MLTPFLPGINEIPELPDHLKNLTPEQAIENANIQAKQRALERDIRLNKERLHVAKKLGDKGLIDKYKLRGAALNDAMNQWVKKHPFLYRDKVREVGDKYVEIDYRNALPKDEYKRLSERYNKYIEVLGAQNAPKTLDDFIKIKYNNSVEYRRLKDKLFIQQKINSGEWGTKINPEKQTPHIQSKAELGKSYIYDHIDAQSLLDKYMGTGILEVDRHGKRTNKEIIELDYPIGVSVNEIQS